MVFVDSNVPMYVVGAPHPNRSRLQEYLTAHADVQYVTSVEVLQEIIHRYVAIDRRDAIAHAFEFLDDFVSNVYSIDRGNIDRAHEIALSHRHLSGRDCLHIAVMENWGISRILSLDGGFDLWPGIERFP